MTAQEIYDAVCVHLLTQKAKAIEVDSDACFYRAPNGNKCAIGGVLPDKLYKPEMEGGDVNLLFEEYCEVKDYFGEENLSLLRDLQFVHDSYAVENWAEELYYIGKLYKLEIPAIVKEELKRNSSSTKARWII